MCGSAIQGKQEIKNWLAKQTDIKKIVDVGVGSGTYVKLIGKQGYTWTGIEVFPSYVDIFNLLDLYDEILIGDIYDFALGYIEGGLPDGDLIIFGDVLEHLPREKALTVIKRALVKYKHIVVSIPIDGRPSKIHYGNPKEAHLSNWTYDEVKAWTDWELTLQSKGIGVFAK